MKRYYFLLVLLAFNLSNAFAQIRLGLLHLQRKEVYTIKDADIIVMDELIMEDSSRLILNGSKKDNFVHAKKMTIGHGAVISGVGENAQPGAVGQAGSSSGAPCKDGTDGKPGLPGGIGFNAVNLFLYVDKLEVKGTLVIDLTGGDGGKGGNGGAGGNGNRGTKVCQGGKGGDGAQGVAGGNGGGGGNVTFTTGKGKELRLEIGQKIFVKSFGGFGGIGGEGGVGGQRGLGPLKDGDPGKKGAKGADGKAGPKGVIYFEQK